jgi:hypothetical protein
MYHGTIDVGLVVGSGGRHLSYPRVRTPSPPGRSPKLTHDLTSSRIARRTKKIKYLEENVASAYIHLSEQENAEIRKVVEAAEVSGGRYPEGFADGLYAETPEL